MRLLACLLLVSCSAPDPKDTPGGVDSGTTLPEDTAPLPGDVGDPTLPQVEPTCDARADRGVLCLTLSTAGVMPTEAEGADGKGVLRVLLYTDDPGTSAYARDLTPITITSNEVTIGAVPTLAASGPVGEFFVAVVFQDKELTNGLTGHYVSKPAIDKDFRVRWPRVKLEKGVAAKLSVELRPRRTAVVGAQFTTALITAASASGTTIHADGPVQFIVYDGDSPQTGTVLDVVNDSCENVSSLKDPKVGASLAFPTTITGSHKLHVAVLDWGGCDAAQFPCRGALVDKSAALTIDETKWLTIPAARALLDVHAPYTAGDAPATDPAVCK